MLTSKQRAYLRALSVELDTILMVGKSGIGPELIKQADDALTKRELIKGKVLAETSPIPTKDAAAEIAEKTGSELVMVIGSKFCLYRKNIKEPKIVLPRQKKAQL